jgi:hypothetical protein
MQLAYSDGRLIAELTELSSSKPIGNAPVEFSARISKAGETTLNRERAEFYRAVDGDQRFTLTIDSVAEGMLAGTIRRR